MKWKFALVGLILMISVVVALDWEPGKNQEEEYWDTTTAPTVTVPLQDNGIPFNITITSWDTNSLNGKVTISFPVYAPAGLKSCLIESKTVHLSYFSDPKVWTTYRGNCELEGKTINIPGIGEAPIVKCSRIQVGEGVTYFNVTCTDNAGQTSSRNSKFIIDKMKPYIDKDTITYEKLEIGTQNAKFDPKIYFDVRDLSSDVICTIRFPTIFKKNGQKVYYTYLCMPSSVDGDIFEIKTHHMVCSPETMSIPAGFFDPSTNGTITCTDGVGNQREVEEEGLSIFKMSQDSGKVVDLIENMCRLGWQDTPETVLNTYGIYSPNGNSPEKDNTGLIALVTVSDDSDPIMVGDLKRTVDSKLSSLAEVRQCAGGIAACTGFCALDIFTLGGAKNAAKTTAREAMENQLDELVESAGKQLDEVESALREIDLQEVGEPLQKNIDEAMDKIDDARDLLREGDIDGALSKLDELSSIRSEIEKSFETVQTNLETITENIQRNFENFQEITTKKIYPNGQSWGNLFKPKNINDDLKALGLTPGKAINVEGILKGNLDDYIKNLRKFADDLDNWKTTASGKPLAKETLETNRKLAQWAREQANMLENYRVVNSQFQTYQSVLENLGKTTDLREELKEGKDIIASLSENQGRLVRVYALFGRHPYLSSLINPLSRIARKSPGMSLTAAMALGFIQRPLRRVLYYMSKKTTFQETYQDQINEVLQDYYYIRRPETFTKGNELFDKFNMLFDAIVGIAPCGDLIVAVKQTILTPDYPDLIVIYDKSIVKGSEDKAEVIQPGHSYLIQTRIERIDMSSGWPPGLEQIGQCLFGCPDYACVVTVVPNQEEYK